MCSTSDRRISPWSWIRNLKKSKVEVAPVSNSLIDARFLSVHEDDQLATSEDVLREHLSTRSSTPLDMLMRPEEKSRPCGEQCIEGCGDVMEMALTRRDEAGRPMMTGPRSQPASRSPSPRQEAGSTRPHCCCCIHTYCATHHRTLTIHLHPPNLPRDITCCASSLLISRVLAHRRH